MSTMYCNLCKRPVEAKRNIGIGSLILIVLTFGVWLLAIPFYSKRCAICKSDSLSDSSHTAEGIALGVNPKKNGTNWLLVLGGLAVIGVIGSLAKPKEPQTTSTSGVTAKSQIVAEKTPAEALAERCSRGDPHKTFEMMQELSVWNRDKEPVLIHIRPENWSVMKNDPDQQRQMVEAFANVDACLAGKPREIRVFSSDSELIGTASPSSGIRMIR